MNDYLKKKTIENLVHFYYSKLRLIQAKEDSSKFLTVSERRTLIRNGILTNDNLFPRSNILSHRAQKILEEIAREHASSQNS